MNPQIPEGPPLSRQAGSGGAVGGALGALSIGFFFYVSYSFYSAERPLYVNLYSGVVMLLLPLLIGSVLGMTTGLGVGSAIRKSTFFPERHALAAFTTSLILGTGVGILASLFGLASVLIGLGFRAG